MTTSVVWAVLCSYLVMGNAALKVLLALLGVLCCIKYLKQKQSPVEAGQLEQEGEG